DVSLRRQRADTLPSYIDAVSVSISAKDLPHNPKRWTPSQSSVYLTATLHVRSGVRRPEHVARDITSWVRREAITGRTFRRWTDEDLQALGVNTLLRGALLAAPEEDENEIGGPLELSYASPSVSNSSSPDLLLALMPTLGPYVRTQTATSTHRHRHRRSDGNNSSTGSDADAFPTTTIDTISPLPFQVSAVVDASEEPSIEDLLVAESESKSPPMDGSWGARAWEDLDTGVTVRRAVLILIWHTIPSSHGAMAVAAGAEAVMVSAQPAAGVPSDAPTAEAGVQVGEIEDGQAVEAELEKRERALEDEVRGTRTLLEEFRRRLEDVEARVGVMEAKWCAAAPKSRNDKAVEAFFDDPTVILPDASCDDTDSERSVVRGGVGLGPESVSELPSYVFLVGLGVCTLVLQLVLKRVAGRSLRS
ncbi:hypothetical protein V8E53_015879, partial [Lactarius tabidus]